MEKEKVKEGKEKEKPLEKDMVDLAADAEEEKDADAEKEEEKAEKVKEGSLDKCVRKVTAEKESLVEKVNDLCATTVENLVTLPQSVSRIPEKEKAKERVSGAFTVSTRFGTKKVNNGMKNGRVGTTVKDNNSSSSSSKRSSQQVSSSQPSVRMVGQARGNESVRRVKQESTVTIEEVEDEVVDLIGVLNNYAKSSNVRVVKEKPVRFQTKRLFMSDSEDGMPKKEQRGTILYTATRLARLQLEHRNYPKNKIKRRANVLRAQWNETKDQNDMVKEILDYLKDYPETWKNRVS